MNGFSRVIVLGMVLLSMINCSSTRDPQPETARPVSPPQGLVKEPVFGGEVFLQTAGNPANPAVVLVHGLGNEAATAWEPTMEFLRKDFFVFAFDLPGFGRSSKVNALYSPENYGRLIHYLTQKYVRKPFHLVGHSMGGAISLQYAADYPQDVQTLTLVDAAGVLHRLAYSSYLAPLGIDFLLKDYNVFSDNVVADVAGIIMNSLDRRMPVDLDKLVANALFRQKVLRGNTTSIAGLALVLNDFSAVPEKIKAPTLIIWGDEDNIAPLRTGVMLRALIPQSSLRLLPGGDHMAFYKMPQAFNALLMQQLKPETGRALWEDPPVQTLARRETVSCQHEHNQTYSGDIGVLSIEGCQNVLIHRAHIGRLIIGESSVTMNETEVANEEVAVTVQNSSMEITAGRISGAVAIDASASRLDIAGTRLEGRDVALRSKPQSTVVFSLGRIKSSLFKGNVIHGQYVVAPGSFL